MDFDEVRKIVNKSITEAPIVPSFIVTVDGHAAAGKSTASKFISDTYGIHIFRSRSRRIKHYAAIDDGQCQRFLWRLINQRSRLFSMERIVVDEYWLALWEVVNGDLEQFDYYFDILMRILGMEDGVLPSLSFYLEVTYHESCQRWWARQQAQGRSDNPWGWEPDNIPHKPEMDDRNRAFWRKLASVVGGLHIIDAMRPESEVLSEIKEIVDATES